MSFTGGHVDLLVRAHEDERRQVRRVHVRVGEPAAEREDLLDVALVRPSGGSPSA